MRPIKFRCYNKETGNMIDLYKTTPLALDANLNCDGLFIPFKEGYEIMQFTGLLDKNGKEIYEGDIVSIRELYETPEMTFPKYVNWEVVFLHGTWHLQSPVHTPEVDECSNMYQEFELYDGDFEVVGNIHENPDLLNP